MRHFLSIIVLLAVATLSIGCAIGPHSSEPSVTADTMDFLKREWPLAGPPVLTPEQRAGHGCSCCSGGCSETSGESCEPQGCETACVFEGCLGSHDSNGQPAYYDPVPAVPLEPGVPGRFFPVPVRPVFTAQGDTFSAQGG